MADLASVGAALMRGIIKGIGAIVDAVWCDSGTIKLDVLETWRRDSPGRGDRQSLDCTILIRVTSTYDRPKAVRLRSAKFYDLKSGEVPTVPMPSFTRRGRRVGRAYEVPPHSSFVLAIRAATLGVRLDGEQYDPQRADVASRVHTLTAVLVIHPGYRGRAIPILLENALNPEDPANREAYERSAGDLRSLLDRPFVP